MKKLITLSIISLLGLGMLNAQSKKEKDIQAIKSMCGCFEVGFNFIETFNYLDDPEYVPSKEKHTGALELAQLIEESDNKIVIQHLLVMEHGGKSHIIKHWRQDWIYENRDFYLYNADNKWVYNKKPKKEVLGQWTQKVYQVDDSPRYEGSATWVHVDGKSYWENTTDAPLPRREYTQRSDYNLTIRGNRVKINDNGWVHEQDNKKVVRENGEDKIIAEEKGYNPYKKVDMARCKAGQDWWNQNKKIWTSVRKNWDKVFARNTDLSLKLKVNNKRLFEHLFSLENDTKSSEIEEIITEFVER